MKRLKKRIIILDRTTEKKGKFKLIKLMEKDAFQYRFKELKKLIFTKIKYSYTYTEKGAGYCFLLGAEFEEIEEDKELHSIKILNLFRK